MTTIPEPVDAPMTRIDIADALATYGPAELVLVKLMRLDRSELMGVGVYPDSPNMRVTYDFEGDRCASCDNVNYITEMDDRIIERTFTYYPERLWHMTNGEAAVMNSFHVAVRRGSVICYEDYRLNYGPNGTMVWELAHESQAHLPMVPPQRPARRVPPQYVFEDDDLPF